MSDNKPPVKLSKRQHQVLEMVATGASNQEIAGQLVISVHTVKVHLRNIFGKLGVQSRTEATLRGIQEGWIQVDDNTPTPEETLLPAKTYLLPLERPPVLVGWQQLYLGLAVLLAVAVMVIPLIPVVTLADEPYVPFGTTIYKASVPTAVPATGSGEWLAESSMPSKRAGLALAVFEGRIFVIGGAKNGQASRSVDIYDSVDDRWLEGATKLTAVTDIAAGVIGDKIYLPGGCTDERDALDVLEIYTPETDEWQPGPALPEPRCGYGLAAFKEKLYLFGGWNGDSYEGTVFVFDAKAKEWAKLPGSMPQAKGYVGAAVLDEAIYLVGGYDGENEFNQAHIFRPATEAWEEMPSLLERRGGLELVSAADGLYAIGGGLLHTVTSSEKYDPATDSWTRFDSPFSHAWRNMGAVALDTKIYAVGGWNNSDERFMDTVVSYQFLHQLFLPIGFK